MPVSPKVKKQIEKSLYTYSAVNEMVENAVRKTLEIQQAALALTLRDTLKYGPKRITGIIEAQATIYEDMDQNNIKASEVMAWWEHYQRTGKDE